MARTGRPPVERVTVPCASCGKPVIMRASDYARRVTGRVFCNLECQHRTGGKPRTGSDVRCERCGQEFYRGPRSTKRFCSRDCVAQAQVRPVTVRCGRCGTEFSTVPSTAKRFCSRACYEATRTTRAIDRSHNGKPVIRWTTGYLFIYEPDHPAAFEGGWVAEHRWLMEQQLGRRLATGEHVHHVNGVKDDNRLENLEVLSHSEHSSLTGRERQAENERMAAELVAYRERYGPLS